MEADRYFVIAMYGLILLMGMLAWQIYEVNNNLSILGERVHEMDVNFYDQLHYQIGKVRSHILANTTVDNGNVNGRYFPGPMNILVYAGARDVDSVQKTAHHEIGHYVWYEILNDSIKDEWMNTTFDCYPTNYSKTDYGENFAESYAFWYIDELKCTKQLEFFNKMDGSLLGR